MKKNYLFIILLSLNSLCSFGQDCITERIISDPTICLGENAIITLFNSETGMDYQLRIGTTDVGSPVSGLTGTDITFSVSPSITTIYNVIATSGAICTITYSDVATVTVNPLPIATAGSNSPQCAGSTLNLTASGGISYSWTGPNGFTSTSQNPSITNVTTAASGTYTVTVTDANSCFVSASTTIVINPLPIASAGSNSPQCAGSSLNLTASGGISYSWMGPNGFTSTSQNPSITNVTTAASGTYTVTVTDNNGCINTATVTVTVNALLVPSVNIGVNPGNNICAGTSVTFTATPVNGGATPIYQWKINGVNVGINSPTFTTSSLVNTDKVTVVLTSSVTCPALANVTSNIITMTVNDIVIPSVSISASATTICPGNSINFSAIPINGGSTPSYQWMINGFNAGTNSPNFAASSFVNGDIVTVELTSNAPCSSPTTAISNPITITVNPATPATPGAINGTTPVCPGITTLTYDITLVLNATTYTWTVPTGWSITAGAGTNSIIVTSGSTGQNGNISVTAGNSCGTSAARTLAVTVSPATPVTPGAITGTVTQCPALTGQTYTVAPVTNATTYNWTVPTGWSITAGTGTNSITITSGNTGQNGNISVTAENSCGTSAARTLAVTVSPATPATPGAITGTVTQCPALAGQIYSVAAVTNATTYTWTVPTGWSITAGTGTNSITVTSGNAGQNGTISVTAGNSCGTSSANTLAVTVSPATPATPGVITGTSPACPGITGLTYSIAAVANATTYTWTVPTGWSITAGTGTNSITVTSGSAGQNGTISVTAENSCGTNAARTLAVTVSPATPATPGAITGTVTQCPALTGQIYSIAAVTNATTYTWTVPTGWSITAGAGTNSITVTSGSAGQNGNITVTAGNSCGTSTANSLAVTISPATPATPGVISGTSPVCPSITGLTYNISAVANATTYTWTVPTGWSITAGTGTNSITVTSGTAGQNGNISVTAGNSCGTSPAKTLAVTVSPATPATPGAISGSTEQCISKSGLIYSITAVPNATSYTWALPSGWSITTGVNTNSITVSTSGTAIGGNITVTATNSCGTSSAQTFVVTVNTAIPVTPAIPTSPQSTSVCPVVSGLQYSVTAVANATSYTWTLPTGWIITAGSGTNSITVTASSSAVTGNISVKASNACGSSASSANLLVTVGNFAFVDAGVDQVVCAASPDVSLSPTTGGATGNNNVVWSSSNGGSFSPNANKWNATYTPGAAAIAAGTVTLTITSDDPSGSCTAVSDQMIVTITPIASIASVTGTSTLCSSGTTTYIANSVVLSGGIGTWSSSNTAVATVNSSGIVTGIAAGNCNIIYTITGGCGGTKTAFQSITINAAPTVNAGGPKKGGGATTGAWSITSGGGLLSSTAQTATPATVTYTPATNFSGTVTLTLTTNAPSACSVVSATRTITINTAPTVNAGGPDVICQSATPANFSGTVTLTLTTNAASACSVVSATRTITINAAPTVNAGGPDVICQSATPGAITLAGATLGGGATTGAWSITSGGGLLSSTAQTATPATVTYTPAPNFSGTVTLTLTTNAPSTCSVISATRTITINAAPTVNAGSDSTICSNTTATMAGSFGGSATSATWSTSGSGTFNNNTPTAIYTPSAADIIAGIITLTYTTNDPIGPCSSVNAAIILTIKKAVVITTQPSNTSVCASFPVNLSVVAIGDGLTYQWYKGSSPSGTPVANSANISGAQSTNLHFNQANLTDDGNYYVIIGGASPCASATSAQRTLNVDQAIIVSTQPVSQVLCTGSNVTFTVVADANGDPLSFQWRKNGINIGGATSTTTSSTLTINNSTAADAANYDVLISGPAGYTCSSVQSAVAALTVNPLPTISGTLNVCESSTTQLSGSAAPAAVNPWVSSNTSVASVSNTGLVTGITAGTTVITYTNSNGCKITATVLVNSTPNAIATNATQTICSAGAITTIVLSGNVAATTFNWTRNNTVAVTGIPASGTGDISGSLTNSTNAPVTVIFTITPVANGCPGTPITATVLVNPTPNAVATPASQTICSANAITTIAFSGSVASTTFNWTRDNTVAVNGIAASGSGNISGNLTNTTNASVTVTFTIIPTANGCPGTPITASVLVNPTPNAAATNSAQTICSANAIATMVLSGSVASTTFNWTRDNTVAVTGILASGSGNISGSLTNSTNAPVTVTFNITPTANGCPGTSITTTVLINPTPNAVATPTSQTICSASAITTIVLSGSVVSTTFNWTRNNTGTATGIAASGSGNISGNLTNTTNAPVTVTFTITPTVNGCPGIPITATVLVNPTPNAVATPASQTICSANTITAIVLSGNVASTIFNWTRDNTVAVTGILASGSGNISGTLTNTTNAAVTVTFTIIPTVNGCSGTPITATAIIEAASVGGAVTVSQPNILPVVKIVTVCHSASGTIYLSGHTGTIVRWESSTTGGASWTPIVNTGTTYNYTNILATTLFRAVIQNASCTQTYSAAAIINVIPNIKPSPVSATPSTICNGDSTILSSQSGYATSQNLVTGGAFDNSNPTGWLVDGCGNCLNAGSSNTNPNPFQLSATNGGTYSGINYTSVGKFAIANGNFNSILQTPVFTTLGLSSASLSFDQAYFLTAGASAKVEISIDGGLTYNTILAQYTGPSSQGPYNISTNMSIDLSAYLGQTNLKIRFNYQGTVGSSWAIDNIKIPEAPVGVLTSQWIDTNTNTVISNSNSTNATVSPSVTTTYAVTSFLNGCTSFGPNGTTYVTVTVNQRPTASIGVNQTICYDGTATFSVALTGTAPWSVTYSNGTTLTTVNNVNVNPFVFTISNIITNKTYTITALSDSKCTAKPIDLTGSATVTVLNGTAGLWTGLVSTDWFDCKNWAGGLPSSTINAQIPTVPSGGPRMPVIDPANSTFAAAYSNIASAQDIIIASGASVTMASIGASNLQISRDWKNSGSFIPGIGTVTFNGGTANQIQTVNLGIKTNETFYNLTTNNSGTAKGISLVDNFELTVSNILSLLSGDIRLTGEAQLVQAGSGANPIGGSGKLLRDQQGQKNSFNYNYWSSPVSLNNTNYSISGILRDGTDVTTSPFSPGTINFGDGAYFADGVATNPIKISNRWLFAYNSLTPDSNTDLENYYQWNAIGNTGLLKLGEGFTMKGTDGTASLLSTQNYVFVGKPNSGTISLSIGLDQTYLIGNPYASALDADEFIKDNLKDCGGCRAGANIFSGALYFWDHFGLTSNHFLAEYVGGYATYTLMGGLVAIADDPLNVNNGSTGTKTPKRYIPVAQGFFVDASLDPSLAGTATTVQGGTLNFKNSQRAFIRESSGNSIFMKQSVPKKMAVEQIDPRSKIRLSLVSAIGINRQLLVGVDSNTTNEFDIGYDAPMLEIEGDNIYWEFSNSKFVIQGVPDFNDDQIIPIGLTIANEGLTTIKIDALENVPETTEIYLYDNVSGNYHDMKNSGFAIPLAVGEYNNRFSLRFTNKTLGVEDNIINDGILVLYSNNYKVLIIQNKVLDTMINEVHLFNLLGQDLTKWDVENRDQTRIQIPIKNLSSGIYIVKLKTSKGDYSKKIIIK
ncbi:PKD-like domain-containing protein [Flavobacterium sp. AED]|uniref:PKD-like domain-containing protein n=1 Tax=Flavobacterium sp. AED TaxID=1423323 RepID=UPI00057C8F96|nr:PKD-like domain-containing protein [Flavobacterium sp. AED]KIA85152.1 hypothetical protein OA85_12145 [Flavobacterium sp. AED]